MNITEYMSEETIFYLDPTNRDAILKEMVDLLEKKNKIADGLSFFESLIERERVISTGIGMGVAIPHARLPNYNHFFVAVGIINGSVDWTSLDGSPVRLVFLVGGPDDKYTEYLQLLSSLTQKLKDEEKRQTLLRLEDPKEIIELFKEI